jgi:predicted transcriptional regulator
MANVKLQKCRHCNGTGKEIDQTKTGEDLRGFRQIVGLSLRSAAKLMKISAPYLSDLENGHRTWTEDRINQYRELLSKQ